MKKALLITLFLAAFFIKPFESAAQIRYNQFDAVNHQVDGKVRFKLYPTFNMWTFLKLDTQTGLITQVQYSTDESNEFECFLGAPKAPLPENHNVVGRYELYPTTNNWTFVLVDQIDGDVYHVQWNQDRNKRFVIPIKLYPLQ